MRNLFAAIGILALVAACGDDSSSGYWQDPRDDLRFEGWQEPEEEVVEVPVSDTCSKACAEIDYCFSALAANRVNDFTFPLEQARCLDACTGEMLKAAIWTCLTDTTGKEDPTTGDPLPSYCSNNKQICFDQ